MEVNLETKTRQELIEIIKDCLEFGKVYLCPGCHGVCLEGYVCPTCSGEEK